MTKSRKTMIVILSVFLLLIVFTFIVNSVYIFTYWSDVQDIYIDYKYGDVRSINPYYLMMVCFIVILSAIIGLIDIILLVLFFKNKHISKKGFFFLKIDKRLCMISALLSFILITNAFVLILKAIILHFLYKQLSFTDYKRNQEKDQINK